MCRTHTRTHTHPVTYAHTQTQANTIPHVCTHAPIPTHGKHDHTHVHIPVPSTQTPAQSHMWHAHISRAHTTAILAGLHMFHTRSHTPSTCMGPTPRGNLLAPLAGTVCSQAALAHVPPRKRPWVPGCRQKHLRHSRLLPRAVFVQLFCPPSVGRGRKSELGRGQRGLGLIKNFTPPDGPCRAPSSRGRAQGRLCSRAARPQGPRGGNVPLPARGPGCRLARGGACPCLGPAYPSRVSPPRASRYPRASESGPPLPFPRPVGGRGSWAQTHRLPAGAPGEPSPAHLRSESPRSYFRNHSPALGSRSARPAASEMPQGLGSRPRPNCAPATHCKCLSSLLNMDDSFHLLSSPVHMPPPPGSPLGLRLCLTLSAPTRSSSILPCAVRLLLPLFVSWTTRRPGWGWASTAVAASTLAEARRPAGGRKAGFLTEDVAKFSLVGASPPRALWRESGP